ncbi:MAG: hypothetical protein GX282_03140 [Campylobacteraceae bacterium]|nr:hypothetical protein [Campylobacteraceae bacterium]
MSKELIKIYLILDAIVITVSLFIGNLWLLNTQISFLLTMLIAFASYKSYTNLVDKELHSGKYDDLDEDEVLKVGRFSSLGAFLSPYKITSYILFGLALYLLVKFNLLNVLAILAGVSIYPVGTLIYAFLRG